MSQFTLRILASLCLLIPTLGHLLSPCSRCTITRYHFFFRSLNSNLAEGLNLQNTGGSRNFAALPYSCGANTAICTRVLDSPRYGDGHDLLLISNSEDQQK